jgi:hypothetical protein
VTVRDRQAHGHVTGRPATERNEVHAPPEAGVLWALAVSALAISARSKRDLTRPSSPVTERRRYRYPLEIVTSRMGRRVSTSTEVSGLWAVPAVRGGAGSKDGCIGPPGRRSRCRPCPAGPRRLRCVEIRRFAVEVGDGQSAVLAVLATEAVVGPARPEVDGLLEADAERQVVVRAYGPARRHRGPAGRPPRGDRRAGALRCPASGSPLPRPTLACHDGTAGRLAR